jgi:hypothetical protein
MTQRPGTDVASAFFKNCNSPEEWQRIDSHYGDAISAIAAKKKNLALQSMDNFWRNEFAPLVKEKGHFTLAELSRIMAWKLARGKFRPLQKLCDSNAEAAVIERSTEAVQALKKRDWKGAMGKLTTLKAIGEATASALLAPLAPDVCPFMADEVLEVTYGKRDYTAKAYGVMREQLVAKGEQLGMQAEQVGRVVWVVATLAAHGRPVSYTAGSMGDHTDGSNTKKRPAVGSSGSSSSSRSSSAGADDSTNADDSASSSANKRTRKGDVETDESVPVPASMQRNKRTKP